MNRYETLDLPKAHKISHPPFCSFFGYYDKCPWDETNRYLLGHRVDRTSTPTDHGSVVTVGHYDLEDGNHFTPLAETTSWNWQQGAMLQWLETSPTDKVLFNRATDCGYQTVVCDLKNGHERTVDKPLVAASPRGDFILSYDFSRLAVTHPTIGYFTHPIARNLEKQPSDDGLFCVDLRSGEESLILSYAAAASLQPLPSMNSAIHWFTHAAVNPTGTRILFLHRWTKRVEDENQWFHRLITANPDGSSIAILQTSEHPAPSGDEGSDWTYAYEENANQISHPVWVGADHILAWSTRGERSRYHLYTDRSSDVEEIGGDTLRQNGHFTISPNKKWLLSDTYPDPSNSFRSLFLFHLTERRTVPLGDFFSDPHLAKEARCDLHPRWRRDGQAVCIDSVHEGDRQLYTIDVSHLVDTPLREPRRP